MPFKQLLADDIGDVFLDLDEFATKHTINGQSVDCVTDEDVSLKRGSRQSEDFDGIYARRLTVFVRESDIGYRPERDQKMAVDGEWYMVVDCAADAGMLEIHLGANRP
jgi:hypothetical protein